MGHDGRATTQGAYSSELTRNEKLPATEVLAIELSNPAAIVEPTPVTAERAGKLVVEEEVAFGHVGWDASKPS